MLSGTAAGNVVTLLTGCEGSNQCWCRAC